MSGTPATVALVAGGIAFIEHVYAHDPAVANFGLEAAEALGLSSAGESDRLFKTLVVVVDGRLVVAIVPVTGTLDLKALATAVGGKRAAMADVAMAERRTGYVVGGISPMGQKTAHPTVLDETAELWDTVFVSGDRHFVSELTRRPTTASAHPRIERARAQVRARCAHPRSGRARGQAAIFARSNSAASNSRKRSAA